MSVWDEVPNLKNKSIPKLKQLCDELRSKIIDTVMKNGGHLSSNLGMVELTVALHYVFDFPEDNGDIDNKEIAVTNGDKTEKIELSLNLYIVSPSLDVYNVE